MSKTNFDLFLEEQLRDPDFAERFKRAGEAWDVALTCRSPRAGRSLAGGTRAQTKNNPATNQPARIAELRRSFSQYAAPGRPGIERSRARHLRKQQRGFR